MQIRDGDIVYYDIFEIMGALFNALTGGGGTEMVSEGVQTFLSFFLLTSFCLSALFLILIIIIWKKFSSLQEEIASKPQLLARAEDMPEPASNQRWEHVLDLISSDSPGDWRLAILEADIVLDDMISRMGYQGDSLGEKLKIIEQSDFRTINDAWEAHKVRNILAHRGSDYILTKREARRVIDLYARVFEEFQYI